jgi:hypothetical protein
MGVNMLLLLRVQDRFQDAHRGIVELDADRVGVRDGGILSVCRPRNQ